VQDQPVARVCLDQLARREVVLEIDDHGGSFGSRPEGLAQPDRFSSLPVRRDTAALNAP
jgi:hypothetical protein